MGSRAKRSTRNQNPTYTFKMKTDIIEEDLATAPVSKRRQRKSSSLMVLVAGNCDESQATSPKIVKLSEDRKNEILELLKRDMSQQSTIAQVGSAGHIRKLAEEVGVPQKELKKWLGITDDLTQVTVSSSIQFKENEVVPASANCNEPSKDTLKKLDEEGANIQEKLHELEDKFQEEKLLPEEELMTLVEQVEEKQKLRESDLTPVPIIEDNSPVLEETSVVAHGSEPIDGERLELVQARPFDDNMMETDMPIWNQNDVPAAPAVDYDHLGNEGVVEMWNAFMASASRTDNANEVDSETASQNSEYDEHETNEVFEDALGEMEVVEQSRNESPSSSFVCHQSTEPDLKMSDLASVPNPESKPTFDVSNCTSGAIRSESTKAELEGTVQPNHSTCSAEHVGEPEKRKSKVLVTRKITDYFQKLSRGKQDNKEE